MKTIETYNIWGMDNNRCFYCATVLASSLDNAVDKVMKGCAFTQEEVEGWTFTRGHPRLSNESNRIVVG